MYAGWAAGADPCAGWRGVRCRGGRVSDLRVGVVFEDFSHVPGCTARGAGLGAGLNSIGLASFRLDC